MALFELFYRFFSLAAQTTMAKVPFSMEEHTASGLKTDEKLALQ